MRNPISVALDIMDVVPEDKKWVLEWCVEDFSYKAPEQMGWCFERLFQALYYNGVLKPILTEEWEFKVASILSTKSIEECKQINEEEKEKLNGK